MPPIKPIQGGIGKFRSCRWRRNTIATCSKFGNWFPFSPLRSPLHRSVRLKIRPCHKSPEGVKASSTSSSNFWTSAPHNEIPPNASGALITTMVQRWKMENGPNHAGICAHSSFLYSSLNILKEFLSGGRTAAELMQRRQGYVEAVTILIRSAAAVPSITMDTFAATTLAEREEDSHFPGSMYCQHYLIH